MQLLTSSAKKITDHNLSHKGADQYKFPRPLAGICEKRGKEREKEKLIKRKGGEENGEIVDLKEGNGKG